MSFAAEQTARYNLASYNIEGVRPEDQHDNSLVIWLPKSVFEAVAYPDREGMMTTVGGVRTYVTSVPGGDGSHR